LLAATLYEGNPDRNKRCPNEQSILDAIHIIRLLLIIRLADILEPNLEIDE
jgi:hypothetical protein